MRPDRLLLLDMLEAVEEVIDTTPPTMAEFDAEKLVQSHVLRHIQIIGEAGWRISPGIKDNWPEIPWKKIAGMRHVLVHDYFEVNWKRVYETARDHVPALKATIEAILADSCPESP